MPADSDHADAKSKWDGYPKQAKRALLPQELSIQAFTLYQLRFIFAADLCLAWSKFGCLGPQRSHLSTVLHIGVAESVGEALSYHRIVGTKLREKARKRTTSATDFVQILESGNIILKEKAKKEMALAIEADSKKTDPNRDPIGKG